MNNYELELDRFIVSTIDFSIQLNNAITNRIKKEHNIEDIKQICFKKKIYLFFKVLIYNKYMNRSV